MPRRFVGLVLAPLLVMALALGAGSWASGRSADVRSPLAQALDVMPSATIVAGFTDWQSIRSRLGLGRARTAAARATLADKGSLRDLTTRSVLGGLIDEMHDKLGWSAADVDWEAYSRAESGSAMAARLADDVSLDEVEDRLDRLGYTRRGGLWSLAPDDGAVLSPQAAGTLAVVAVDRDRRLVVAADRPGPVRNVLATARGDAASALSNRPLADVAQALIGSDTAVLQGRAFGCRATSVTASDATVRAQARAAVARAGTLTSPTFTGRGLVDGRRDQTIRFVAAFGSRAEATDQLRVRSALTTGPFIGRTGRVEDTLDLRGASVDGTVATLRFAVDPDKAAYMSGEGPLLFAGCAVERD
ncbi:MAG: hypothetical protein ABWY58_07670 [Aeromicrobium sp.]